jgi:zinc protease
MRRGLGIAALVAVTWPLAAHAADTYAERVREKTLSNGLKVILLEDHKAPVATFQVWYRAGSRNEQLGKTGLAHLLEHLMFKGTDKVGPEEYSKIIQRNGGNENAFTANDSTTYFATIASDRLGAVIELESDRMHNLKFEDAQFVPEHKVVMEERRLRTDNNPVSALFEQLNSVAYSAHPYEWPVIGWMNDLRQLTRDDALVWYRTYYAPGNAFVVVVGDFVADDLFAQIEKAFGPVPPGPAVPAVRAVEPLQQGQRRAVLEREAQLPFVVIGYHVPNLRTTDAAALEVLAAVLAGGKSARLYDDLVYKKRLAREAGANYDLTSADPGLFYVFGQPLPGKRVAQVEEELLAHVARMQRQLVGARELTKAKNGLEADTVVSQDSLFYQAMLLGQYEIAGDWRWIDNYLPGIRAVTADDLQRVASFYLTEENRSIATLQPLPVAPGKPPPQEGLPQGMVH